MRVRWTRRALRALDAITDYIAQDRPIVAERVLAKVHESVATLADHPHLGRTGRVADTRELIVPGTSLIVPYRLVEDQIQILTVLHAARKWPAHF
jgi:addiction module RelE/StbE family toxin